MFYVKASNSHGQISRTMRHRMVLVKVSIWQKADVNDGLPGGEGGLGGHALKPSGPATVKLGRCDFSGLSTHPRDGADVLKVLIMEDETEELSWIGMK